MLLDYLLETSTRTVSGNAYGRLLSASSSFSPISILPLTSRPFTSPPASQLGICWWRERGRGNRACLRKRFRRRGSRRASRHRPRHSRPSLHHRRLHHFPLPVSFPTPMQIMIPFAVGPAWLVQCTDLPVKFCSDLFCFQFFFMLQPTRDRTKVFFG